jgi:hypothetical protein
VVCVCAPCAFHPKQHMTNEDAAHAPIETARRSLQQMLELFSHLQYVSWRRGAVTGHLHLVTMHMRLHGLAKPSTCNS